MSQWKFALSFRVHTLLVLALLKVVSHARLSHVCVGSWFGKRRPLGQQHPPETTGGDWLLEKRECTALWDWAFRLLGTMGGFHGWLIPRAAATTAWEKQNGVEVHVCQVGTSVTARRQLRGPGRVDFSTDQGLPSASSGSHGATERMWENKRCRLGLFSLKNAPFGSELVPWAARSSAS